MGETVFERPEALADVTTHYCPGCTHGVIHRLVAEVLDELGVRTTTVQLQVPPRISGPYDGSHETSLPSCMPA